MTRLYSAAISPNSAQSLPRDDNVGVSMSKPFRTLTESKHELLLARLMKWRPVSIPEEPEKQTEGSGVQRSARRPFDQLDRLFPNLR